LPTGAAKPELATYTTLDAAGARRSSGLGDGIAIVVGGVCSTLSYSMVLAAALMAPVGYVASVRESSVILGAAAGWVFLNELPGRARLGSALVVTAGLVLLIVWQ
jgi:drug/metabolite transporter (DMT)-like permease